MIIDKIKDKFEFLTKKQKQIARYILSTDQEIAFLTISQLARRCQISESSIVRFCRAIGYKGYPDLQKEFQNVIREKLSPPEALQIIINKKSDDDIYSQTFETDYKNLQKTRELNNNEKIELAINEIIKAKRIGIMGFRSSHSVAYLLYFHLGQLRKNCDLLEFHMGGLPNHIVNYGPQDLLIGISLPRYSKQTLSCFKYVKKKKCKTIAITDSTLSPIAQEAHIVLLIGNRSCTYFNSLTSAVTLVNCIIAGVSLKSKRSLETLKEVDGIVKEWGLLLT